VWGKTRPFTANALEKQNKLSQLINLLASVCVGLYSNIGHYTDNQSYCVPQSLQAHNAIKIQKGQQAFFPNVL
jgi:hypothetical protein